MDYFAVHYHYVDDPQLTAEHRPAHRQYLQALIPAGLVAAGAYPEAASPGALIIVRAESAEAVAGMLDADPFRVHGVIADRIIQRWTPVIGMFTADGS
ncbi:MAG: YciI family protein [Arachnia sp.]